MRKLEREAVYVFITIPEEIDAQAQAFESPEARRGVRPVGR